MPASLTTDVEICNLALSRVRANPIGDLQENSAEAVRCRIHYEPTRDWLLTAYSWKFANATRALSRTSRQPPEWLYEYDYPNDCLRVHYILPYPPVEDEIAIPRADFVPVAYEVASGVAGSGSRVIWTNCDEAYIKYTKFVDDERLFDPLFGQMFAWALAVDLAIPLGGDSGKVYRKEAQDAFERLEEQATAHAANEAEPGTPRMPKSIRARTGGLGTSSDNFYDYRRP